MSNRVFQTPENLDYAGIEELWKAESNLSRYNNDVVRLLSQLAVSEIDVLEFGAGLGTLAKIWSEQSGVAPECLEIDPVLREVIESRGYVCYASTDEIRKKYDLIYSSNVLEHIEDDVVALQTLHGLLKDGGVLALYLPAFPCLYSSVDASIGHYRRYTKRELKQKLISAGFSLERLAYSDCVGFFAWLTTKLGGSDRKLASEESLVFYDKYLFPISKMLDAFGLKHFFGKNLLAIARKA